MIERNHLRILRTVERQGSVTSAAESLHLTQSALSHSMKKLERQFGLTLWTKEGRRLRLTPAGEYLLREANRLLPQLERLDDVLSEFAAGQKGNLRIGMECHPCYRWLLSVVDPYLAHWPGIDLDVRQQFQFGGLAALFNHDIDILVTPDPVRRNAIHFEPVFPYELVLAVSVDNPLSQKHTLTPDDLLDQVLYCYPVAQDRLDIYQQFLHPANCLPRQHRELEATEMLLQMVAANRGVTALPEWLVRESSKDLPIVSVRLGARGIHKHIHLGIRTHDRDQQQIHSFVELAKTPPVRAD